MDRYDEYYMLLALKQAQIAADLGEIPVGAVIVRKNEIVSTAFNRREMDQNALAHAEILAIDHACCASKGWRLFDCTLYVTLEPCPMCTGAVINSRIKRVVYGAPDFKAGSMSSIVDLTQLPYNHKPVIEAGLYSKQSINLLQDFFRKLRNKRK